MVGSRRTWLATCVIAPIAGGLLARATGGDSGPEMTPRERIRARHFPNVTLTTHEGKTVRFYDDLIKNKIVVINFMYTRCEDGLCPVVTANLVQVQRLLGARVGRDIFMYSITLKPEHDTPQVLKRYAKAYGVGPGWWFLTGKPDDTELLRRKLGFVDPDPEVDKDKSNHIGNVLHGNEPLMLWSVNAGMARPGWIVRTIGFVARDERGCECS